MPMWGEHRAGLTIDRLLGFKSFEVFGAAHSLEEPKEKSITTDLIIDEDLPQTPSWKGIVLILLHYFQSYRRYLTSQHGWQCRDLRVPGLVLSVFLSHFWYYFREMKRIVAGWNRAADVSDHQHILQVIFNLPFTVNKYSRFFPLLIQTGIKFEI